MVAVRLWVVDGPKTPLTFITLWILGLLIFPRLGWVGPAFIFYEAGLAVILLVIEQYKSATR